MVYNLSGLINSYKNAQTIVIFNNILSMKQLNLNLRIKHIKGIN